MIIIRVTYIWIMQSSYMRYCETREKLTYWMHKDSNNQILVRNFKNDLKAILKRYYRKDKYREIMMESTNTTYYVIQKWIIISKYIRAIECGKFYNAKILNLCDNSNTLGNECNGSLTDYYVLPQKYRFLQKPELSAKWLPAGTDMRSTKLAPINDIIRDRISIMSYSAPEF